MSTNSRKLLRNTVPVKVGCSCRRLKLCDIFRPSPKTKSSSYRNPDLYPSSSSPSKSGDQNHEDNTATALSPKESSKTVTGCRRFGESIAVVKDSDDPYLDFRHSMLQMILENDIYSRDDLRELLDCFLQLNSPDHYDIIVHAFTEIWNCVFPVKASSAMSREF